MNTSVRAILVAVLACQLGCAPTDWVKETFAVDVTGTWRSTTGGLLELALEQDGPKVRGSMRLVGLPGVSNLSGPVDGAVSGDTFHFTASP